jgi:hypothetical protein
MVTDLSLKKFKEKFRNDLLDIHWGQWAALGVSSYVPPERYWIVDLEALISSTVAIGLWDQRLLSCSMEWLVKNAEWMNLSRLKRISLAFMEPIPGLGAPLLAPKALELYLDHYNDISRKKISFKKYDSPIADEFTVGEYESFFNQYRSKDTVTKPKLKEPSLIQLFLRSIFGVNAHVEILIYLLTHESGNSNLIAREIFYNQKNVHKVLGKWTAAQFVTKISEKRASYYSLKMKKELEGAFGMKETSSYLNWTRNFIFLNKLAKALSTPGFSDDTYLLSSFFRDFLNEAKSVGKALKFEIPEPDLYPGGRYFTVYAAVILRMLKELKREKKR